MSTNTPPPVGWGADELSQYLDTLRDNQFASFALVRRHYELLSDVDKTFRRVAAHLDETPEWFASLLFRRAYSAFLASCGLALSAQVAECYPVLRSCLEYSLYGLHISQDHDRATIWLNRHITAGGKHAVRKEFSVDRILATLHSADPRLSRIVKDLYEQTIDLGAHPNEQALSFTSSSTKDGPRIRFNVSYVSGGSLPHRLAIKSAYRVGVASLGIFKSVFRERFTLLGIDLALARLEEHEREA